MSADNVQSAINAPPFGLLDLLQTKALGQNPNELLQGVRPTVDLQWMWAGGSPVQTLIRGGNIALLGPAAVGAGLRATVPPGKIWIPISIALTAVPAGAGDTGRVKAAIGTDDGVITTVYEFGPESAISAIAATGLCAVSWNFMEFPIRAFQAGTVFMVYTNSLTVVTTGLTTQMIMRYLEFGG